MRSTRMAPLLFMVELLSNAAAAKEPMSKCYFGGVAIGGRMYRSSSLFIAVLLSCSVTAIAEDKLARIEQSLEKHSSIEHVDINAVEQGITRQTNKPVLFDVRTLDEFEVSHLPGAIRLDPDTDPNTFLRDYDGLLEKEWVIFYCSTGRRSTELAEEVAEVLDSQGKRAKPANMKGGIFRWHNESLPLMNATGTTDSVHPYNWFLKRLLHRKEKARYSPME